MEPTMISFTLSDLYRFVIALCGLITAVAAAIGIIVSFVMKMKAPNKKQDERIDAIEKRLEDYDRFLDKDNKRLDAIEDSNRLTQRALLALLKHGIDGNEIDEMRQVEHDLREYLIERK